VNGTGHSHPDVVRAITEQAGKYLHMSGTDFYYEPQVRLAEDMAQIVPVGGGPERSVVLQQLRRRGGRSGAEAARSSRRSARTSSRSSGRFTAARRARWP
jgi:4-aminobutyrate aminotransferase